jgi:hypothetical protein
MAEDMTPVKTCCHRSGIAAAKSIKELPFGDTRSVEGLAHGALMPRA